MNKKNFPIFLTGSTGLFGKNFLKINKKIKNKILYPNKKSLNITKKKEIISFLNKHKPKLIIHAAALVGIRACKDNKLLCKKTNVDGTRNIFEYAKKNNIRLIYISTDYVFDGRKGYYKENDKTKPQSIYGKSKLEAEKIVSKLKNYLIIRTSFFSKKNWKYKEAFVDQYTSKIEIRNLIFKINKVLFSKLTGIINISGKRQSLYEIAKKIDKKVKPISLENYTKLSIPRDISLNNSKWDKLFNNKK